MPVRAASLILPKTHPFLFGHNVKNNYTASLTISAFVLNFPSLEIRPSLVSTPVKFASLHSGMGLWSRRRFLARNAMGVGSVALAWLLRQENLLATPPNMPRQAQSFDLKPKVPPLRH